MNGGFYEIYVYLSASPLLGLTLTLVAFQLANRIYARAGQRQLANPVLVAVGLVGGTLMATGISYEDYFEGAQFVHFLLGPATVALALPLYRGLAQIRRVLVPVLLAVVAGSLAAIASAMGIASALGASERTVISLAPKSATAPVAMSVSEQLGGLPPLTAVAAVITGIVGAVAGIGLLRVLRLDDPRAQGLAMGVTSHGIGTARALQMSTTAGAFSSLGFALNAIATSALLPVVASLASLDAG